MNILEVKLPLYQTELKELYQLLQFKDYPLELKGSSRLLSQKYPSDYDFYTHIDNKKDKKEFFTFLNELIYKIKTNIYMYFIELKVEYKNEKLKFFKKDTIEIKDMDKVELVKLDIIIFINNTFKEVSVIYDFGKKKSREEYLNHLKDDIEDLKKENNYFKVMKRMFSISTINKDYKTLEILNEILNSPLGELNKIVNNMETLLLVRKYYKDRLTSKRIDINKQLLNIKDLKKEYKRKMEERNKISKEIYNRLTAEI